MNKYGKSKQIRDKNIKDHRYLIYEFNEETIKKINELEEGLRGRGRGREGGEEKE